MLKYLRPLCYELLNNANKKIVKCRQFSSNTIEGSDDKCIDNINREEPTVIVEKDEYITIIGLNRERKRNSIDAATTQKLTEAIHEFEQDDTSPVAVLYGIGGTFSAGYDLTELEVEAGRGSLNFLLRKEGSIGPTRRHLHKPIVCGINGYCVASGLELALMCDIRVMEDTAVLGFFNRRLGVPISDGGTVRLAAAVGYSNAMDIIQTGRRVDAHEALRMGLINRLVATGTALGQAVHTAFTIAKFPIDALQHDRMALFANTYDRQGFNSAVHNEIMNVSAEMVNEMQTGVKRFKNSPARSVKGVRVKSWNIRDFNIPDWEKEEIAFEEQAKMHAEALVRDQQKQKER